MAARLNVSAWDAASLILVACLIVLTIGVEYVLPMTQASAMAPKLSKRLGVPRESVEKEVYASLNEGLACRIAVRAVPLLALGVLLAVRIARDQHRKSPERSG